MKPILLKLLMNYNSNGFLIPKILVFIIVVIIVSIFNYQNIILGNRSNDNLIKRLFPQGWAFFTKSPRSQILDIFELRDDKFVLRTIHGSSKENLFGFSRYNRRIGFESSVLSSDIVKNSLWKDTLLLEIKNITSLIDTTSITYSKINMPATGVKNFSRGRYLFLLYDPKPWFYHACKDCIYRRKVQYSFVELV